MGCKDSPHLANIVHVLQMVYVLHSATYVQQMGLTIAVYMRCNDGWPSKTIGHLFYATSSFVQHFVAIGEFKLELQSGNSQSVSNATLFRAVWPWNLTDDLQKQQGTSFMLLQAWCNISWSLVNSNRSYSPETPNLGQMLRFLEPCDLEIWWMTLKNNRAPLLCYFKLGATFHGHWWIQTGVTVRKRPIWVKCYAI